VSERWFILLRTHAPGRRDPILDGLLMEEGVELPAATKLGLRKAEEIGAEVVCICRARKELPAVTVLQTAKALMYER